MYYIDPCTSNPCQNGGLCSWDGTTMNCVCANDYIGAFCQIAPGNVFFEILLTKKPISWRSPMCYSTL
jgi:hypothetical protein